MKTTSAKFISPSLVTLFILVFMLLPVDLWAILGVEATAVTFKILDATKYHAPGMTSLDIEVINSDDYVVSPGRRFNVELVLSPDSGIKIGQTLQADFTGMIDDLGSGRISVSFDPNTVLIIDDNPACVEIPWSIWEPVFDYLPVLKIAFILFWWLVVIQLVSKKGAVTS
ncbi:MAG: hypothetical protein KKB51_13865 [Candidatus Riflebacteria bacterium]|nr:hypothetical protein [Candidatus Riflebacteria bacterium]